MANVCSKMANVWQGRLRNNVILSNKAVREPKLTLNDNCEERSASTPLAEIGNDTGEQWSELAEMGSDVGEKESEMAMMESDSRSDTSTITSELAEISSERGPGNFDCGGSKLRRSASSSFGDIPSSLAPSPAHDNAGVDGPFDVTSSSLDPHSDRLEKKEEYATIWVSASDPERINSGMIMLFYEPGQRACAPGTMADRFKIPCRRIGQPDVLTGEMDFEFDILIEDYAGKELSLTFEGTEDEESMLQRIPSLLEPHMDHRNETAKWACIDDSQYAQLCGLSPSYKRPQYRIEAFDMPYGYEERLTMF